MEKTEMKISKFINKELEKEIIYKIAKQYYL